MKRILLVLVLGFAMGVCRGAEGVAPRFQSAWLAWELAPTSPAFARLGVDSLGGGRLDTNPVFKDKVPAGPWTWSAVSATQFVGTAAGATAPGWEVIAWDRGLVLRSHYVPGTGSAPFTLVINQDLNHATLLARVPEVCVAVLPGVLQLPDLGSFRVTCSVTNATVHYDARRAGPGHFVQVDFPPADEARPVVDYRMEVALIHPDLPGVAKDRRFDGFRRNWLNALQMHARLRVLANNSSSDTCGFCIYEYADIAAHTPPLAPGLTALDLIRDTLDRYLDGQPGYGMPGYAMFDRKSGPSTGPVFLDTYPSLLISASLYARGSGDVAWVKRRYAALRAWADLMLAMDHDGNGLIEYPYSGNSGSWEHGKSVKRRPANWWDTIGFGHEDAYSNALAFRALREMSDTAVAAGAPDDAKRFTAAAEKLRAAYAPAFFHPETGLVAGWKSADGERHEHAFTFVNGIAVAYGLLPREQANAVMDRLLARMKAVGYTRFDLGIPGNLVPVPLKDYVHADRRWGGGVREDNADGFQIYENGGATACFSYFLLAALYRLDRGAEADAMLMPMLGAFERGEFQGRGPGPHSKDWKAWDGTPWGYEGFLTDNYYTFLAVMERGAGRRPLK